jgi:hypothetical protein
MNVAALGTGLVFTGEGQTMYTTAAGAPAVVLGHEAENLMHFAAIAAVNGGYATQQQDYVILGFVNGRLTVIGGESKAVIVTPERHHEAAKVTVPPAGQQSRVATLQVTLDRIEAQIAAAQRTPNGNSAAIALLKLKEEQILAALAELQSSAALPNPAPDLTGLLVDIAA